MFEIETAREEDISQIRALAAEIFPRAYARILSPEQTAYMMEMMYSRASLESQFRSGHVYFLVRRGGTPVGYLSVEREKPDLFHLQKIYLDKKFRGMGGGKLMFEAAADFVRSKLRESGQASALMELNVNRNNPAVGFYEKMGMRKLREGDFDIGGGFFMNDFIMGIQIRASDFC